MKQIIGIVAIAVIYIAVFWLLPFMGTYDKEGVKQYLITVLIAHIVVSAAIGLSVLICWSFGLI